MVIAGAKARGESGLTPPRRSCTKFAASAGSDSTSPTFSDCSRRAVICGPGNSALDGDAHVIQRGIPTSRLGGGRGGRGRFDRRFEFGANFLQERFEVANGRARRIWPVHSPIWAVKVATRLRAFRGGSLQIVRIALVADARGLQFLPAGPMSAPRFGQQLGNLAEQGDFNLRQFAHGRVGRHPGRPSSDRETPAPAPARFPARRCRARARP
jgi:hypothetical protein